MFVTERILFAGTLLSTQIRIGMALDSSAAFGATPRDSDGRCSMDGDSR